MLSVSSIGLSSRPIPPNTKCIKIVLRITLFQTLFYSLKNYWYFFLFENREKVNFVDNGQFDEKRAKVLENVIFPEKGQFGDKCIYHST